MWDERNCLSFEMAVDGIEPPSPRLTVRRSAARPPLFPDLETMLYYFTFVKSHQHTFQMSSNTQESVHTNITP